ncbi:hypothetical protein M8C21_002317, partial [Ambrosia artemisiifolia]
SRSNLPPTLGIVVLSVSYAVIFNITDTVLRQLLLHRPLLSANIEMTVGFWFSSNGPGELMIKTGDQHGMVTLICGQKSLHKELGTSNRAQPHYLSWENIIEDIHLPMFLKT